jgi:hypothetical protein
MRIDRIDFVEKGKCFFCHRDLPTQTAYIIDLGGGREAQSGPDCAKRRFKDLSNIPNFTKAAICEDGVVRKRRAEVFSASPSAASAAPPDERSGTEKEYLLLRCKLLSDFANIGYAPLNEIYGRTSGALAYEDRRFLTNMIAKLAKSESTLSHRNLMACYMSKRVLLHWIKEEDNEFAKKIYEYLKKNYRLSEAQISAINGYIAKSRRFPKLNHEWFVPKKQADAEGK